MSIVKRFSLFSVGLSLSSLVLTHGISHALTPEKLHTSEIGAPETSYNQFSPRVTTSELFGHITQWTSRNQPGSGLSQFYHEYDLDGNPIGDEVQVSGDNQLNSFRSKRISGSDSTR